MSSDAAQTGRLRRGEERDYSVGGIAFALALTIVVHAALYLMLTRGERGVAGVAAPARKLDFKRRSGHGEVAYERRKIENDCVSIPECTPVIQAQIIEIKIAKLGQAPEDKTKLPELQKYEQPKTVEVAVNVEKQPTKMSPQQFARKLDQLKKKPKKTRDPFAKLLPDDDDPRKRETPIEKIVGRLDGDVSGSGTEQEERDTYFMRVSFELSKAFAVPSSITRDQLKTQVVEIIISQIGADGTILKYRINRRASLQGFTLAAEGTVRLFMPSEGGRLRLPVPDAKVLDFINKKGFIAELNGKILSQF